MPDIGLPPVLAPPVGLPHAQSAAGRQRSASAKRLLQQYLPKATVSAVVEAMR
jgi:hypothetical protein